MKQPETGATLASSSVLPALNCCHASARLHECCSCARMWCGGEQAAVAAHLRCIAAYHVVQLARRRASVGTSRSPQRRPSVPPVVHDVQASGRKY